MKECPFCVLLRSEYARMPDTHIAVIRPKRPKSSGHRLFIPMQHVEWAHDLSIECSTALSECLRAAVTYGQLQREEFKLRVNVGRHSGQTVAHLHVHYQPTFSHSSIDPFGF